MTRILNSVSNSSSPAIIKFLYSYGGEILPLQTDGKLRYIGGHTRILATKRSVSYAELIVRFSEACGFSVNLKCALPSEDLDVLVSVTSDEDLAEIMEEYDQYSPEVKIRVVLFPVNALKTISPVPSVESLLNSFLLFPVNFSESKPMPKRIDLDFLADRRRRKPPTGRFCRDKPPILSRFSRDVIRKNDGVS